MDTGIGLSIGSLVVSISSLIVSILAFHDSAKAQRDSIEAQRASVKAQKASCYQENARNIDALYSLMYSLNSENSDISPEKFESHVERILNAYEHFCADYEDDNIDKERFEKSHKEDIRRLFENEHCKKKLDTRTTQYPNIVAVYDKLIKLKP